MHPVRVETQRDVTDWGRVEWCSAGPGSGRSPCQLSMLLASRSLSLQRLDEILDKVPIQPCPRHGLPLPVFFPLSVWPVIPDCLDTSQHAIPHPSQPGLFSLLNIASQHWLAGGLWRATEKDRTMPGSFLSRSHSSHSRPDIENAAQLALSILLREQLIPLSRSKSG